MASGHRQLLKDLKKLKKLNVQSVMADADKPLDCHLAFVPQELNDNVIELTSVKLDRGDMTTVVLGIICQAYTKAMWRTDVKNWEREFPNSAFYDLDLETLCDSPNLLNAPDAIKKIDTALTHMNAIEDDLPVRLILVGPGHTKFTMEAIQHLLKQWKMQTGGERVQKRMHFIISGDNDDEENFDLCKQLCLTGVCHSIQFYNTMYYNPFGYYKKP